MWRATAGGLAINVHSNRSILEHFGKFAVKHAKEMEFEIRYGKGFGRSSAPEYRNAAWAWSARQEKQQKERRKGLVLEVDWNVLQQLQAHCTPIETLSTDELGSRVSTASMHESRQAEGAWLASAYILLTKWWVTKSKNTLARSQFSTSLCFLFKTLDHSGTLLSRKSYCWLYLWKHHMGNNQAIDWSLLWVNLLRWT